MGWLQPRINLLEKYMTKEIKKISSGHNACAGCGQLSAVQSVMRALDKNTIIANATGCLEVTTTAYPQSAWGLPWIHSLFENPAAVATGISAALKKRGEKKTKVVVMAGDGGTFDIGMGIISGMWERKEDILYICYDTESYSNTGFQASGATPYGASTSTSPKGDKNKCQKIKTCDSVNEIGNEYQKKDMIKIALAHDVPYVAQSTAGYPNDIFNKVKKALTMKGPGYIQILSPCIPGWKIKTNETVELGKLANLSNFYPLLEYVNGQLISGGLNSEKDAKKFKQEYLGKQGRFKD
ncbi:pyruvate ferredoxin oxidoreductase [Candidatus Falkowbacteria bacterium HGW-Falkowbacteria-1]|uniref:Pyruvate ferredoxin oxidoreductase n=1 Tax=Candidatus Falkowbacteria bacterium HGW-Falkowbacteria-1 TaxID=2013768 RepID=A0A2N2E8P0_9BACT|nr:MAG: pyruvate ferredoxin oxidoreductase [Candidatus Falkowbacteria bacterium HGW-Falkowbacteria-1]